MEMEMDVDDSTEAAPPSSRWPVEIWLHILSHLDVDDLKNASLTSSFYRKIAIKLLFSTITLRFGLWQSEEDRLDGNEDLETERYNSQRSLDILLCLARDAAIARAVGRLTVYAFARGYDPLVFESHHIEYVLPKLNGLREFRWIAGFPPVPLKITKALRNLESDITVLLLNGLENGSAEQLCGLNTLRVLDLIDPNQHSGEWDPEAWLDAKAFDALINSDMRRLRELSLSGTLATNVNIQRLADSLTRLAICGAGDCVGLDIFLRRASALKSLSIVDCKDFAFLKGASAKGEDGFPLKKLQNLKLSLSLPLAHELAEDHTRRRDFLNEAHQLVEFLALHDDLRRFDFAVEPAMYFSQLASGFDSFENAEWFGIILNAVCKLGRLTALGISVPKLPTRHLEAIKDVLVSLPKSCIALRLTGMAEISYYPLIEEVLCTLPNLSFLCISNWRPLERIQDWVPLPDVSDLLRLLPNLRLVCHNSVFYDVHPAGLSDADFPSWRAERVRFRSSKDFPSEDAYWLMAYRFITKRFVSGPDDPEFAEEEWNFAF